MSRAAADPEFERRTRESFGRQGIMAAAEGERAVQTLMAITGRAGVRD